MTMVANGVLALVFARGNSDYLGSVIDAVEHQTLPVDRIVIVDVDSGDPEYKQIPQGAIPPGVTHLPIQAKTLGMALNIALSSPETAMPARTEFSPRWWILHDDSIPESRCLEELWQQADSGRSIGAVGPKQVSADGRQLLELGIQATRDGRRLELSYDGEADQGQHDHYSDVLALGTAGLLLDCAAFEATGPFDRDLGPFGEGLDYGRRLHRAGYRVVVAPKARIRHLRTSYDKGKSFGARRTAQLHNWLLATSGWSFLPVLVWAGFLAVGRAIWRLAHAHLGAAWAELSSYVKVLGRVPRILSARHLHNERSVAPRSVLRSIELSGRQLREGRRYLRGMRRRDSLIQLDETAHLALRGYQQASRLHWLAISVVTVVTSLLMGLVGTSQVARGLWPAVPDNFVSLWRAAWTPWLPGGDGFALPAEPWTTVSALLAAPAGIFGVSPAVTLSFLLWAATPLAAVSAGVLARTVTTSLSVVAASALLWASLPMLTIAQGYGLVGSALAHAVTPLFISACLHIARADVEGKIAGATTVFRWETARRHGKVGLAALALLIMTAAHPFVLGVVLIAFGIVALRLRGRILPFLFVVTPSVFLVAPTVFYGVTTSGTWRGLLAQGGPSPVAFPASSWELALGMPLQVASLPLLFTGAVVMGILLLWALLGSFNALRHVGEQRTRFIVLSLVLAPLALFIAFALQRIDVEAALLGAQGVWPGVLLTGYAAALLCAAIFASSNMHIIDSEKAQIRTVVVTPIALIAIVSMAATVFIPAVQYFAGDAVVARLQRDVAKLPAAVSPSNQLLVSALSAQGQESERSGKVAVLGIGGTHDLDIQIWRHTGVSLIDTSALSRALMATGGNDLVNAARDELVDTMVALTSFPEERHAEVLSRHGIDTILIPHRNGLEEQIDALNRAPGLETVGQTDAGTVWRVRPANRQPALLTLTTDSEIINVGADDFGTKTIVDVPGTLSLALRSDAGWKATVNGNTVSPVAPQSSPWRQSWVIDEPGQIVIKYSTTWQYVWWVIMGLSLLWMVLACLPVRRRR